MTKAQLETFTAKAHEVAMKAAIKAGRDNYIPWSLTLPSTKVGLTTMVKWILKNQPEKKTK